MKKIETRMLTGKIVPRICRNLYVLFSKPLIVLQVEEKVIKQRVLLLWADSEISYELRDATSEDFAVLKAMSSSGDIIFEIPLIDSKGNFIDTEA